eukprot:TRINITY_DN11692_c0_g1_i12.p2 TRINITY_DN11692_c0_g1~~TRINITY_DN11692_c0_g1_i12.p2  ORF type:complete len:114 (-),score=34.15 TRINITY_DN11692_c0_g1_i12:47-388(-)
MNDMDDTTKLLNKKEDLIFYAQRFDDYCGYEALVTLLIITIFSCQVFSLIPPLSQQAGVIIEYFKKFGIVFTIVIFIIILTHAANLKMIVGTSAVNMYKYMYCLLYTSDAADE